MNLVFIKLIEVFSRALFTVGSTYLLGLEQTGQFGLANTLIALFAFAFGWERHIDVQRRLAGVEAPLFDRAVAALPRFWAFNWLAMMPILILFALLLARLDWIAAALVVIIAITEQIATGAYNLAVIESRYHRLVVIVAAKSLFLALALAVMFLFYPSLLDLDLLLAIWTAAGLVSIALLVGTWHRLRATAPQGDQNSLPIYTGIFEQHRASLTHFLAGGLAVLMLQIDRLVVGTLLPLDLVGQYFRHIVLVSFAYQFFNVASYNRKLGEIFQLVREGDSGGARRGINQEYVIIALLTVAGLFAGVMIDQAANGRILQAALIDVWLVAILLIGALVRIYADFMALILNARFQERRVLLNQLSSFLVGLAALAILTWRFGLYGAAWGSLIGGVCYLALNVWHVGFKEEPS